jgi:biopolymer transport protein ExbD
MAATQANEDEGITGINVTPLVDVTLVLLVIFMVTAKLIVSQAIPLELPKAASAGVTQTVLNVSIDANGTVHANGREVDDAALTALARSELARDKELRTVISAAKTAQHGSVIHVLDELRLAGVQKIAFAAEKKP